MRIMSSLIHGLSLVGRRKAKGNKKMVQPLLLVPPTTPVLSVEQHGPRDRLLLCRGASGSAHPVNHTRCLTDACKI